jgi:hypothetical protein
VIYKKEIKKEIKKRNPTVTIQIVWYPKEKQIQKKEQ